MDRSLTRFAPGALAAAAAVAIAVAAVSMASGAIGPGWPFREGGADRRVPVGEAISKSGVQIELVSATATSSETHLIFLVRNEGAIEGELINAIPGIGRQIQVEGLKEVVPLMGNRLLFSSGAVELHVTLGAAETGSGEVTVTIPGLFLTNRDGHSTEISDEFAFVIDLRAVGPDPMDRTIMVDQSLETASGETLYVESIHVSSSGLQVAFHVDRSLRPIGYPARLITPEGEWLAGYSGLDPVGERVTTVVFPGAEYVPGSRIAFGPFERSVEGPFEIKIELDKIRGAEPGGQRFGILGDTIEAAKLTDTEDGFEIVFHNVTKGERTVAHDGGSHVSATDDLGNKYSLASMGFAFLDGPEGEPIPEMFSVRMIGKLDPDARTLTLMVTSLSKLEAGPEFTLPPLAD